MIRRTGRATRPFAVMVGVAALAVGSVYTATSAGAAPVNVGLNCKAYLTPPGGVEGAVPIAVDGDPATPGQQPQASTQELQAPANATEGTDFTVTIPSTVTPLPATSTGFTIVEFVNIATSYKVTGGTFVDGSVQASGPPLINGNPGTAGTPVVTSDTLTIGTPGPVPGGGTLTSPVVTFKVHGGAAGSTVTIAGSGTTLTAHLTGGISARTVCDVHPAGSLTGDAPVLASTLMTAFVPPPPPGAPTAVEDSATTDQGKAVKIDVLANDKAADSDTPIDKSSLTIKTAPKSGTAVVNSDSTVTYTPNAGFAGTDTFQYQICSIDKPAPTTTTTTLGQLNEVDAVVAPVIEGACHFANVTVTVKAPVVAATTPTTAAAAAAAALPRTGQSTAPLAALGLFAVAGGLTLLGLFRRQRASVR
jgi:LPXTG-motif cell wall-anchored protein